MVKKDSAPSEKEWVIMEVLWKNGEPITSSEIIGKLMENVSMTPKMVRVLLNRLFQKRMINYIIDKEDARVYHYYPLKTREECLKEKSKKFADSFFSGNQTNAIAALLQSVNLTEEQIDTLEEILKNSRRTNDK